MGAAMRKIQAGITQGVVGRCQITEDLFQQYLYTQVNPTDSALWLWEGRRGVGEEKREGREERGGHRFL
jgi:hypothetical protein